MTLHPTPVVPIAGTVVAVRLVEVDARQGTDDRPGREAFAFREVDVLVAAAIGGAPRDGLTAVLTCTTDPTASLGSDGEAVSWLCSPYATTQNRRGGGFTNVVRFRFVSDVASVARPLSSAKSA